MMGLGSIETQTGEIAELALSSAGLLPFREGLLDRIERVIGFDKASAHSHWATGAAVNCARHYENPAAFDDLPRYMMEFEPRELVAASTGKPVADIDVMPASRRARMSLYRSFLWPERISVFITVVWRLGDVVSGMTLARTGRGARFTAEEMRTFERLIPTIRIADGFLVQQCAMPVTQDAWAADAGLTAREHAVATLAIRGLENREIGAIFGVSPHTVRNQLAAVFRKTGVSRRSELAFIALNSPPGATVRPRWMSSIP